MRQSGLLSIVAFWFLGIIWGSNFIFMKWSSEWITPSQIVLLRVLFGFIPIAFYAGITGSLKLSHIRYSGHFLAMTMLATVIYYYCFAKGTSLLLSGVAGAVSGAIPLFAFISGVLMLSDEKITSFKIAGVVTGFLGVLIIANPFGSEVSSTNLEGVFYMAIGSLSLGFSFVYAKKYLTHLEIKPAALTTYQLGTGLLILLFITDFSGISNIHSDIHASIGMIVGLGLLGTGLAYIAYYHIVRTLGAIIASSVTYIPPIVALLIGAFLVDEDIEVSAYAATILIFVGVWLLTSKNDTEVK